MPAARPLCFCLRMCSSRRTTTINYFWLRPNAIRRPAFQPMVALQLVLFSSSTHALMLDNLPQHRDPSAAEDSHSRKYSHQSIRRCG